MGNRGYELVVSVSFSANAPETVDCVDHIDPDPLLRVAAATRPLHDAGGLPDKRLSLVRFGQRERRYPKFDDDDAGSFPTGIRLVRRDPAHFPDNIRRNEAVPVELVKVSETD